MTITDWLREVFPVKEAEEQLNDPLIFRRYTDAIDSIGSGLATDEDARLADLSWKIFDADAARRASIDSRAGTITSAISLAAALVTGVGFTAFRDVSGLSNAVFYSMLTTLVLSLTYLTATSLLVFRIHGRVMRNTPDPTDLAPPPVADPSEYPRLIAVKILRYTVANYRVNNRVADQLWRAQKCFRNALLALVLGGLVTSTMMSFSGPLKLDPLPLAKALAHARGCNDLPRVALDDHHVRWQGTCLRNGVPARVSISRYGEVSFVPKSGDAQTE